MGKKNSKTKNGKKADDKKKSEQSCSETPVIAQTLVCAAAGAVGIYSIDKVYKTTKNETASMAAGLLSGFAVLDIGTTLLKRM